MTQYLLSVHMVEGEPAPSEEQMQQAYKAVDAFNAELQAAGVWVFAGGLHPPSTATVVRAQGGEVVTTDGPFAETKEQLGGFWIVNARRPGRRPGLGRAGVRGLRRAGRGPALPGDTGGPEDVPGAGRRGRRARLPGELRAGRGHPGPPLRRHRPRRRGGPGGLRRRHRTVAGDGVPPNPGGWIITTARNKALDRLRRESSRHGREAQAALLRPGHAGAARRWEPVPDDRLRLIFTCCHPALAAEAQLALTLRLIGRAADPGDRPRVPRPRGDHGPAAGPGQAEDPRRAASPTGCRATRSCPTGCRSCSPSSTWSSTRATRPRPATTLIRSDLCAEAIRLARLLAELMPDEPEVLGLLALLLLTEARRPARTGAGRRAGPARRPGPRPVGPGPDRRRPGPGPRLPAPQPARALPAPGGDQRRAQRRADRGGTDWRQILALYDQLAAVAPTPVVALNRCVAVAEVHGPAAALGLLDQLDLDGYHLFHATRADLLRRLGRPGGRRRRLRGGARAHRQRRGAGVPHPPARRAGSPAGLQRPRIC